MKKCSTAKLALSSLLVLLGVASPPARAAVEAPSSSRLLQEILDRNTAAFEPLLQSWNLRYGTQAVGPLLEIVSKPSPASPDARDDSGRYIALMGAAKLGGKATAPLLVPFLKDRSWMIRSGTLRALSALGHPATAPAALPLLRDPALVVRLEAVEAVSRLRPPGAAAALLDAVEQEDNYHGGKAQWVPQKALRALAALDSPEARKLAPRLRPLLDHAKDPELQKQTVAALEELTGKKLRKGAPLAARVREWKVALSEVQGW